MADINISCDVLVVGGSLGGVAAALAAARAQKQVCLLTASDWLGGQMTVQGVCTPDENQFTEETGSTASYREFRQRTRQFYRTFPLSAKGMAQKRFNLGECWANEAFAVDPKDRTAYSVEPKVGSRILGGMLAEMGTVQIIAGVGLVGVTMSADNNTVQTLVAIRNSDGATIQITAAYFLDATDLGDLLPLANVEHVIGAESQDDTKEPSASPDIPQPNWLQPITFPIALERRPANENHTIAKPANYEEIREARRLTNSGKFTNVDGGAMGGMFVDPQPGRNQPFWRYRRVVSAAVFEPGRGPYPNDVATINVNSNDFIGDNIPDADPVKEQQTLAAARHLSLCYTYWLQTECPRDPGDGDNLGYPNLRPVTDFWDTPDGIAPAPYIREGRRIKAKFTVLEQHIAQAAQTAPRAEIFPDACGIGSYHLDIHPNPATGLKELHIDTFPFQIPLGALIPIRVTNVLAACKNLGVTHITNGAYRMHPIEWNVGESAGALAAFCLDLKVSPTQVLMDGVRLNRFQRDIARAGVPLFWWTDVEYSHQMAETYTAIHLLGVLKIFTGTSSTNCNFEPDKILDASGQQNLKTRVQQLRGKQINFPPGSLTRAQAAVLIAQQLGLLT